MKKMISRFIDLESLVAAIPVLSERYETFTLAEGDIGHKYVDLSYIPVGPVKLFFGGTVKQVQGSDFSIVPLAPS